MEISIRIKRLNTYMQYWYSADKRYSVLCLFLYLIDWLKSLLKPPKIDIATIKVSRKVELEEIDISSFARKEEKEEIRGKSNRLIVRRNGLVLDRPTKPK